MYTYSAKEYFRIPGLPLRIEYVGQDVVVPVHSHDFIEIVFVARGCAVHDMTDCDGTERSYGLIQGDVFSVMPDERHGYRDGQRLTLYNLGLTKEFIASELPELCAMPSGDVLFGSRRGKVHLSLSDRENAAICLNAIIRECQLRKPGFRLYVKSLLMEFLLLVGRMNPASLLTSANLAGGILATIRVMEKAPEKSMTLAGLAAHAAMSVPHYTKKFREATGISPMAYLINLRLEKAQRLLEVDSLPVAEIALRCGFCDSNYMIKLFRRHHGITPARYRKRS